MLPTERGTLNPNYVSSNRRKVIAGIAVEPYRNLSESRECLPRDAPNGGCKSRLSAIALALPVVPALIQQALLEAGVGVNAAVAEERPMGAMLVDSRPFHIGENDFLAIDTCLR